VPFEHYLFRFKIYLPYRHARNSEKERGQNIEKIKNIKYKIQNLLQDSIKYLYQKRLNEKLEEKIEDIYGNILESIHRAVKEALGNQEKKKSKL